MHPLTLHLPEKVDEGGFVVVVGVAADDGSGVVVGATVALGKVTLPVAAAGLNKEAAAARLHRALHDSPTDVDTVIEVLTSHSHDQRKKIAKAYKFNHNKVSLHLIFRFRSFTNSTNCQFTSF